MVHTGTGTPSVSTVRELLGLEPLTADGDYNEALWVRDKNGQWVAYVGLSLEEMWVTDPVTGQEVPQFSYGDIYSSNIDTTPDYKARVASPTLPDGTVVFEVGSSVNDLGKTEPPPESGYDELPTELPTELEPGETAYVRANPDTFELDAAEEEARASLETEPAAEEQPPPQPEARMIPPREAAAVLTAAGVAPAEAAQIARDNGVWTRDGRTFTTVPTPRNLAGDRVAEAENALMQLEEDIEWAADEVKTAREEGGDPTDVEEMLADLRIAADQQRAEVAAMKEDLSNTAGAEGIDPEMAALAVEALRYLEEAVAGLPTHLRERDGQQRPFRAMLDGRMTGPGGAAGITDVGSDRMGISPRHFNRPIAGNVMQGTRWSKMGEYAIHHELGHMVDKKAGTEGASFSNFAAWAAAVETGQMSDYGKTNILEGYAEAFTMWQSNPDHPVARVYAERFGWDEEDLDEEQPPPPDTAAALRERIAAARAARTEGSVEGSDRSEGTEGSAPPTFTQEQVDAIAAATDHRTPPPGWEAAPIGDGFSEPYLWTAPDGSRFIAKTSTNSGDSRSVHAEQIAATVLQQIGFPHTPAGHSNPAGTVAGISFVTDGTPLTNPKTLREMPIGLEQVVTDTSAEMSDPTDWVRLFAYDLASFNNDRHGANLFLADSPDGKTHLLPIDHGSSLYTNASVGPETMLSIILSTSIHHSTLPAYVKKLRADNPELTPQQIRDHLERIIRATLDQIGSAAFSADDREKGGAMIDVLLSNVEALSSPEFMDTILKSIVDLLTRQVPWTEYEWWHQEDEE